jgi:hypothetical protein
MMIRTTLPRAWAIIRRRGAGNHAARQLTRFIAAP